MTKPKPAMAAWIARERKRLGLKPADVAARLTAFGLEASEQTIRVWESYANRKPSPDNIDGLERIFGSRSPEGEPVGDQAAVVAAINAQTNVLRELVSAVTRLDRSLSGGLIGVGDVLGPILAALGGSLPQSAPAPDEQRDPPAPENGTPSIPRRGVR